MDRYVPKMPPNGWVHFTGTHQDEKFDWEAWLEQEKDVVRYVCAGYEIAPSTGKPHWQWYTYHKRGRKNIKLYQKDPNFHAQACKWPLNSWNYSKKDKKFVEFGEPPQQGKRSDLELCQRAIRDGATELEIWENFPIIAAMYGRRLEHYRRLLSPERSWKTEVRVWWGVPGCGKTQAAVEWLGADYCSVSMHNGFMIGYKTGAECVLIDDLDHESMRRDMFLQLGDKYKCTINIKNGEEKWNAKKLAITSNTNPQRWFADDGEAVRRRCAAVTECVFDETKNK